MGGSMTNGMLTNDYCRCGKYEPKCQKTRPRFAVRYVRPLRPPRPVPFTIGAPPTFSPVVYIYYT